MKPWCPLRLGGELGGWVENPKPPAAAEADQASSEGGGHEPPAGDGAMRRPEADNKSEIRSTESRQNGQGNEGG